MTREEAARLVAALAANWPTVQIGPETYDVWWNSALANCEFGVALSVIERLVGYDERFPTVARFQEVRRGMERRTEQRALTVAPTTPNQQRLGHEAIGRIRAELEACGSPWGSIEKPHHPPKDWTPRHTGDVTGGTWHSCRTCRPVAS